MVDKAIMKAHRRAFYWNGNRSQWQQHKATCPDCGGFAVAVRVEPTEPEAKP